MPSSTENVLAVLRSQILSGARSPGARISEVSIASEMEVSRTPARTALAALEAEGLIEKRQGRGFTVCSISVTDVANAVAVRAVLEALAARTLAERGLPCGVEEALAASIARTEAVVTDANPTALSMDRYREANTAFHQAIMDASGNDVIAHAYARVALLPLAALGTLVFDQTDLHRQRMRLTVGHSQHVIIFDALRKGDAARAEAMMREHSHATLNYTDLFVHKSYVTPPDGPRH